MDWTDVHEGKSTLESDTRTRTIGRYKLRHEWTCHAIIRTHISIMHVAPTAWLNFPQIVLWTPFLLFETYYKIDWGPNIQQVICQQENHARRSSPFQKLVRPLGSFAWWVSLGKHSLFLPMSNSSNWNPQWRIRLCAAQVLARSERNSHQKHECRRF